MVANVETQFETRLIRLINEGHPADVSKEGRSKKFEKLFIRLMNADAPPTIKISTKQINTDTASFLANRLLK